MRKQTKSHEDGCKGLNTKKMIISKKKEFYCRDSDTSRSWPRHLTSLSLTLSH